MPISTPHNRLLECNRKMQVYLCTCLKPIPGCTSSVQTHRYERLFSFLQFLLTMFQTRTLTCMYIIIQILKKEASQLTVTQLLVLSQVYLNKIAMYFRSCSTMISKWSKPYFIFWLIQKKIWLHLLTLTNLHEVLNTFIYLELHWFLFKLSALNFLLCLALKRPFKAYQHMSWLLFHFDYPKVVYYI